MIRTIKILIDITDFTAGFISEAIDIMVDLAQEDRDLVEKTAVFGATLKLRAIGDAIITLSGRNNIKFFQTKAQALEWLGTA